MTFSFLIDSGSAPFGAAGQAASLLRAHDWQASPIGRPEEWPQPLRTLTSVMLAANQPMFIVWGPEHTLLYNDSYAEILATKHPAAMGRSFLDVWFEIRDDLVPIVRQAYAGKPVHMDDITLVMERRGYPEETHFSFSYTPVRDDAGALAGLFCACTETTEKVLAQRHREAEAERMRRMVERAPGAISILRGPDHVVEFVNFAHRRMFGSESWIGKPMRDAFPDLAGQGYFELLDRVFASGERYVGTSVPIVYRPTPDAPKVERLLDFFYEPMLDEAGHVTGIFTERLDVTESRRAEMALRSHAARQDFRLAFEERLRDLHEPREVVVAAAEALGRQLAAAQVFYIKVDAAGEHGTIEGAWHAAGALPGQVGLHRLDAFGPAFIAELKRGRTVAIGDVRSDQRTKAPAAREAFEAVSVAAFIAVPLVKAGRLVAILAIHDRAPRDWSTDAVALAEEVAERTWALVERARAVLELDRFFDLSLDMLAIASTHDQTWKRVNPAFAETLGWTEADLVDQPFLDIVHADDRARALDASTSLAEGRPLHEFEVRARCRDGSYRWIAWTSVPYAAEGLLYCVGRDVTERRQSEMRFRRMANNLPLNIWLHDREGKLDFVNQTFCDYFGVTTEGVRGDAWQALMQSDDDAAYVDDFRACVRDQRPFHGEFRARRADGTWRWLESWGQPTFDHTGRYLGHVGTSLDVTERRAAKETLVASERRLRRVLDQLFAFVGVLSPEGILEHANQVPLEGAGIALEDVVGLPFDQTSWWSYDVGVQARLRDAMRQAAAGEAVRYEVPVRMAGDQLLTIDFQVAPLRDDDGKIVGLIASAIDIDERKRGERQRELLINELNHRVKNTLAVVQGLALQTFKNAAAPSVSLQVFQARLAALAAAHNLLTAASWQNTSLEALAHQIVTATCGQANRVTLSGPPIELAPKQALNLALVLHELCTNAVKYGALSGRSGHVDLAWSVAHRCRSDGSVPLLHLAWREEGGPAVAPPRRKGFGSRMIERVLAEEFDAEVTLAFDPAGLVCTMTGRLPEAAAAP